MNYYKLLEVGQEATFQELKKAYFRRAKELHPDRHGGSRAKEEQFKNLVEAFNVLSDPSCRVKYDLQIGASAAGSYSYSKIQTVMDSESDDTLEEIIVGNSLPPDTTIGTIFRDLQQTEVFMLFREAKTLYYQKKFKVAMPLLRKAIVRSPNNIVYRSYLARTLAILRQFKEAKQHYRVAISLGKLRQPPQRMVAVNKEYEMVCRLHRPFWNRIIRFFINGTHDPFIACDSDAMVDEMNQIMNKMLESDCRTVDNNVKHLNR